MTSPVSAGDLAILAELLLRGEQSEGDLRGRASRMDPIPDLAMLRTRLDILAARGLVDVEIREVEAFRAESSAGGFYQSPSADGTRPGIFYVNTFNLKAQPKFGMETLSLHEASPGHHFQIAIAQENTSLPKVRRFAGVLSFTPLTDMTTAYVEGWALYAETLGDDEMRITFMGSNPWPPRISQAGTSMMVECGPAKRLFFDLGPGCARSYTGMGVPFPKINNIFLTHLHVDHWGEIPYVLMFGANYNRVDPLQVYGPSGRTKDLLDLALLDEADRFLDQDRFAALEDLLRAQSRIDQHPRPFGADQHRVPGRAAA